MAYYRVKGIIFKKRDLRGADRLLIIYTDRFGKIQALAKGAKKINAKLAGHLENFTLSDLVFVKGKKFNTITNSIALDSFSYLKESLKRIACAYYIAELIDKLIPEAQKDERIFKLIFEVFNKLNQPKTKIDSVIKYFEINFASLLGYEPELKKCVNCGIFLNPRKNYFSFRLGGILCANCKNEDSKSIEISEESIKFLRILLGEDINFIERLSINEKINAETRKIISKFLEFILPEPVRLDNFLKSLGCR